MSIFCKLPCSHTFFCKTTKHVFYQDSSFTLDNGTPLLASDRFFLSYFGFNLKVDMHKSCLNTFISGIKSFSPFVENDDCM